MDEDPDPRLYFFRDMNSRDIRASLGTAEHSTPLKIIASLRVKPANDLALVALSVLLFEGSRLENGDLNPDAVSKTRRPAAKV